MRIKRVITILNDLGRVELDHGSQQGEEYERAVRSNVSNEVHKPLIYVFCTRVHDLNFPPPRPDLLIQWRQNRVENSGIPGGVAARCPKYQADTLSGSC